MSIRWRVQPCKMANQQPVDDALLGKFLAGDTNPVESARVREWLIVHNAGISEPTYDDIVAFERVWEAAQLSQFLQQTDKDWNTYRRSSVPMGRSVDSTAGGVYRPERSRKVTEEAETSQLFNRITAVLALLLSFGWLLYQFWYMGHDHPAIHTVTLVTGNHRLHKTLPDGTRIWLNRQSTLTYPTDFTDNQREVKLRGEAYFAVEPNAEHPFYIRTGGAYVQVTKASLTVNAYENDVLVIVDEGKAYFSCNRNTCQILSHQQGLYDSLSDTIHKMNNE